MRVAQIYPEGRQVRAVAFARWIGAGLCELGVEVVGGGELVANQVRSDADVALVHHEYGEPPTGVLVGVLERSRIPVVVVLHGIRSSDHSVRLLGEYVAGIVTVAADIGTPISARSLAIPQPHHEGAEIVSRPHLKREFGIAQYAAVIGSSGYSLARRRDAILIPELYNYARANNCLVWANISPHPQTPVSEYEAISKFADSHSLMHVPRRLRRAEQNRRLQACDLIWHYSENAPLTGFDCDDPLDQLGAGTRMVLSGGCESIGSGNLNNVSIAPRDTGSFLESIIGEVEARNFARHAPPADLYTWNRAAIDVLDFIHGVIRN